MLFACAYRVSSGSIGFLSCLFFFWCLLDFLLQMLVVALVVERSGWWEEK